MNERVGQSTVLDGQSAFSYAFEDYWKRRGKKCQG